MNAHAEPVGIAKKRLPLTSYSGALFRIFQPSKAPLLFGRGKLWRFDDPQGSYGVLYAAKDAFGAIAETYRPSEIEDGAIDESDVRQRCLAVIDTTSALRLVNLEANGLALLGADNRLCSGPDYALSQRWSRALHQHPAAPDGLAYRSRNDPSRICAAIFERASKVLKLREIVDSGTLTGSPVFTSILAHYGIAIRTAAPAQSKRGRPRK